MLAGDFLNRDTWIATTGVAWGSPGKPVPNPSPTTSKPGVLGLQTKGH